MMSLAFYQTQSHCNVSAQAENTFFCLDLLSYLAYLTVLVGMRLDTDAAETADLLSTECN